MVKGNPVQFVSVPDVGVPSIGVVSVGDVANTNRPEPVSLVTALARLALDGVANHVAIPVPSPDTPVLIGNPVQFVSVPLVGVPSTGVTSVGVLANTKAPVPLSSVTALIRLALDGVPNHVAIPVPSPDTPVLIGSPVQLVSVPADGVPMFGVVSEGDVASTTVEPEPVVVPATNAPPEPAITGADTVVPSAIAGVVVGFVIVKSKPLPSVPVTLVTVPPPVAYDST